MEIIALGPVKADWGSDSETDSGFRERCLLLSATDSAVPVGIKAF